MLSYLHNVHITSLNERAYLNSFEKPEFCTEKSAQERVVLLVKEGEGSLFPIARDLVI